MRSRKFLYHLLFWAGIYLLWIAIFRSYSITLSKTMTIEFCYLLFITADFYAINNFIVPRFLLKRKYFLFVVSTMVIIAVSAWLRTLVAIEMNAHFFHTASAVDFRSLLINSILNISLWVLLITVGKMLIDRIETQRQLALLEKERIKNELDYLKAQINPHALFNSLNTIYGHIDKSNQVARNILLQFSELLRYQLYDCASEKVCLGKEIAYLENYIAFQRLRKDQNLVVEVTIEKIDRELTIAPLLLVVLIENAFKFVSEFSGKENKITIVLSAKNNVLSGLFINTKEEQQSNDNPGGIGLSNLKRRLELLYPEKHQLATTIDKELYQTSLTIQLA